MAFEVIENCKKIYNKTAVSERGVRVAARVISRPAKTGGGASAIHQSHHRREACPSDQPDTGKAQHSLGVRDGSGCRKDPRIGRQCGRRFSEQTGQIGQLFAVDKQGNGRRPFRARVSRVRDRQYRSDPAFQRPATAFRIQGQRANVGG